jgi:glycosyltransferase involved in cell wall biosynthesis
MINRLALVCDWYSPRRGGIEAHLDGLATRLAARGHDVHVITSTPGPGEVNGIPVHRLGVPLVPIAGVAAVPVAREIERILTAHQIDTVHSHVSIVSPVALSGALAAERLGLASVVTFHSFVPATPALARAAGFALGASRWRAVMSAVSRRVAREVEAFAPGSPFVVLPNAIDTSFWSPGPGGRRDGPVRLVYAGRLQAKKRPLLLLGVLRELARSTGGVEWRLTVVGEGPLGRALRDGVRQLGLSERVDYAGWVDPARLREILRDSDVFLSTAARESFGLAALEARSVGLPVVAVAGSAVADFISHEVSGLLAGTDIEFAEAAARLVRGSDLRERIRAFNRQTPVPHDWGAAIERHETIYERAALDRRSSKGPQGS